MLARGGEADGTTTQPLVQRSDCWRKMKITTVLLFVVVALLFNIACSTSVQDVFETEGKLYFEQLFVYTE